MNVVRHALSLLPSCSFLISHPTNSASRVALSSPFSSHAASFGDLGIKWVRLQVYSVLLSIGAISSEYIKGK